MKACGWDPDPKQYFGSRSATLGWKVIKDILGQCVSETAAERYFLYSFGGWVEMNRLASHRPVSTGRTEYGARTAWGLGNCLAKGRPTLILYDISVNINAKNYFCKQLLEIEFCASLWSAFIAISFSAYNYANKLYYKIQVFYKMMCHFISCQFFLSRYRYCDLNMSHI